MAPSKLLGISSYVWGFSLEVVREVIPTKKYLIGAPYIDESSFWNRLMLTFLWYTGGRCDNKEEDLNWAHPFSWLGSGCKRDSDIIEGESTKVKV